MTDRTIPETDKWPDLAGRLHGERHVLPVRVYFEDTDFTGLVYHANYLKFCERGRSDFLRCLGIHHNELITGADSNEPAAFVVRHMDIDFLRPARIDDLLEVVSWRTELGGATLTLEQEVRRGDEVLVRLTVKVVLVSASGKPLRLGKLLTQAFTNL